MDNLSHDAQQRKDWLARKEGVKFKRESAICPVCNVAQCKKACGRCKIRRYCSKKCARKEWSHHKLICRAVDKPRSVQINDIFEEWKNLGKSLHAHQFDMTQLPTRSDLIGRTITIRSREENLKLILQAKAEGAKEMPPPAPQPKRELLLDPDPELLEKAALEMLGELLAAMPAEVQAKYDEQMAKAARLIGSTGKDLKNMPKKEKKSFDSVGSQDGWHGSLAASVHSIVGLPQVAGEMCVSFATNGSLELDSGLMWYLVVVSFHNKVHKSFCAGKPNQTVCEKALFSAMVNFDCYDVPGHASSARPSHVLITHRWGQEMAEDVGRVLMMLCGISSRFEPMRRAEMSAAKHGTSADGTNYKKPKPNGGSV